MASGRQLDAMCNKERFEQEAEGSYTESVYVQETIFHYLPELTQYKDQLHFYTY